MNNKILLKVLLQLKQALEQGCHNKGQGICYHVSNIGTQHTEDDETLSRLKTLFLDYACDWPKHSGNYNYPVPTTGYYSGVDPRTMYEQMHNVWAEEYGELRIELLDFVIGELNVQSA